MSKTAVKPSKKVAAKKAGSKQVATASRKAAPKVKSTPAKKSPAVKKSVAAKKTPAKKAPAKKVALKQPAVKQVVAKKVVAKKAAPSKVKVTAKPTTTVSPVSPVKVPNLLSASSPPPQASVRNAEAQSPVSKPSPKMLATAPKPAKVDPKLANAWKTKPGKDLTDAELLAMPDSEYMSEQQQEFFRTRLEALKDDLLSNAGETTEHLREDTSIVPDPADRATIEEEHALELRTRDRERKLLKKISQALTRLESGDYGYCDETGEPIGLGRLIARPTATLSLEAQQRRELKQRMFGD